MLPAQTQNFSIAGMPQNLPPIPGIYTQSAQAIFIRPGTYLYILKDTPVTAGQSSISFQLERTKSTFSYQVGFSVEFNFSADPGIYEVALQTSDTDQDNAYVTLGSLVSGLNSNFWGRIEVSQFWGLFARLSFPVLTNPCNVTSKVTR